jgi:DNA repair photolyase
VANPPNPYLSRHAEWLEPPPSARLEIYEETSGSILTRNDSPDVPFTWSVNPYRGCQHACAYCYARPYHEYLELGAGTDFETKLFAKTNAPDLLRKAFSKKSWGREWVTFSGVTDCYQPIEASFGITRECLEVCAEFSTPASVITKSFLVVRDIDVLTKLERVAGARVFVSIPFADASTSKLIEPQAPPPLRRFEAVRRMADAGIRVGVMVAPIIPGMNDRDIPKLLEQAAACGASSVGYVPLRLAGSVRPVFLERLREAMPDRAQRVIHRIRDIRGGKLNDSNFGSRMSGSGVYWDSIRDLFEISRKRYGLDGRDEDEERAKTSLTSLPSVAVEKSLGPKTKSATPRPDVQFTLFGE